MVQLWVQLCHPKTLRVLERLITAPGNPPTPLPPEAQWEAGERRVFLRAYELFVV